MSDAARPSSASESGRVFSRSRRPQPAWFLAIYYGLTVALVFVAAFTHWSWVWWSMALWFLLVGPVIFLLAIDRKETTS